MFFAFHAGHHEQISLPTGLALILDARRPDFVGQLHVDEDAGVVGLGRDFDEAPFDGDDVIAVTLQRPKITDGRAVAMNEAVRDAPRFHRVGVVLHAKGEAVEICAVEKFDVIVRHNLRRNNFNEYEYETTQQEFHKKFNHQVTKTPSFLLLAFLGVFVP
jgi:hypothetical protein